MHYGAKKYERINGVNANTNFTLPAGHVLSNIIVKNNIAAAGSVNVRFGGNNIGGASAAASGLWSGAIITASPFSDTDEMLELYNGDWTYTDADVLLIYTDISI